MTAVSPAHLHGYSFYAPAGEVYQSRSQAPFPPHDSPFYCGDSRPSLDAAAFDRGGCGHAEALFLINSVRKWRPAALASKR